MNTKAPTYHDLTLLCAMLRDERDDARRQIDEMRASTWAFNERILETLRGVDVRVIEAADEFRRLQNAVFMCVDDLALRDKILNYARDGAQIEE